MSPVSLGCKGLAPFNALREKMALWNRRICVLVHDANDTAILREWNAAAVKCKNVFWIHTTGDEVAAALGVRSRPSMFVIEPNRAEPPFPVSSTAAELATAMLAGEADELRGAPSTGTKGGVAGQRGAGLTRGQEAPRRPAAPTKQRLAPPAPQLVLLDELADEMSSVRCELGARDLHAALMKGNLPRTVVALYFADWCHHCTKFKPAWKQVVEAQRGNKDIAFLAFNADSSVGREMAAIDGVAGYPTVRRYRDGQSVDMSSLNFPRTVQGILEFTKA